MQANKVLKISETIKTSRTTENRESEVCILKIGNMKF